ncbi:MAG: NADP-dependent oxidoreductase, partial [Pseudomonadales bacterium]|nr:NADP-dependent oxidoreductase [Pseudomonadales bacterium]
VIDYMDRAAQAVEELIGWIETGELNYQVDLQAGFENIPSTLTRLFTGQNIGKQLLKIADPV